MTDKETLELLIPAISSTIPAHQAHKLIDAANEALKNTPWMYFLTGDGLIVESRDAVVQFAKDLRRAEMLNGGRYLNE